MALGIRQSYFPPDPFPDDNLRMPYGITLILSVFRHISLGGTLLFLPFREIVHGPTEVPMHPPHDPP